MKKTILLVILPLIILLFFLLKDSSSKEIRVRVIPNSNSEDDLRIKEEVKNKTIEFLANLYDSDYDTYIYNIESHIEEMNTSEYKASLCNHNFYNKTYDNSSLKNEEVVTFLVTIGEAKGSNWWGSIYPTFLGISSSEEVEYKSYIIEKIKEWQEDD